MFSNLPLPTTDPSNSIPFVLLLAGTLLPFPLFYFQTTITTSVDQQADPLRYGSSAVGVVNQHEPVHLKSRAF